MPFNCQSAVSCQPSSDIILGSITFPGGLDSKESTCNAGDLGSVPGSERTPREGNGNPLQYSCLGNYMDRGEWWATAHEVAKSRTQLSDCTLSGRAGAPFPTGLSACD